jgi:Coenzyme PQQ synthesis protein D (PqqD)
MMSQRSRGVEGGLAIAGLENVQPASDVVARRLGKSAVLIRLTTNRIYELNATGVRVWELVQQGLSRDAVVERLSSEFGVSVPLIRRDVDDLLRTLHAEGLTVAG